ncbi:hypothetical protein ACFQRG_06870 [Scopulibacillus cellulosilyticus]|uniref:Fur-regulated basic protein B n=1 Tax=Scopulibacillus cellulosilyticus TaxID=2665665 RepID=A0ABW2PWP0_9BACL
MSKMKIDHNTLKNNMKIKSLQQKLKSAKSTKEMEELLKKIDDLREKNKH